MYQEIFCLLSQNAGEYKVALVIYSGLPDPVWTVYRHHGKLQEIKSLLDRARSDGKIYRHKQMPSHLGFRGFLLYHPEAAEHGDLIVGHDTKVLQELLLSTMPEGLIPATLYQKVSQAIESGAVSPVISGDTGSQQAAPSDTPTRENQLLSTKYSTMHLNSICQGGTITILVRLNNNCYNYANDKITNSFAQPGEASGHPIGASITPKKTLEGAMSDGLLKMEVPAGAIVPEAPEQPNCLVALVVAEGIEIFGPHLNKLAENKVLGTSILKWSPVTSRSDVSIGLYSVLNRDMTSDMI